MFYDKGKKHKIRDVRIGLGYTAVVLDNGRCGLAYTFRTDTISGCGLINEAGSFIGKSASELIHFYPLHNSVKASVGLATINALANYDLTGSIEGDILEVLDITPSDKVGMVGYFAPLIPALEKKTEDICIFEKKEMKEKYVLPEEIKEEILPQCSVVLLTATVLVNKTYEYITELIKNARICAMLGPSTPVVPEFFKEKGIKLLSGVQVTDVNSVLKIVSEAGGMGKFKKYVRKINVFCNDNMS